MQATLNASSGKRLKSLLRLLATTALFSGSGIVCTSAWQAYGDTARLAMAEWVSSLAPLMAPRQEQAGAMVLPFTPMTNSADRGAAVAGMPIDPAPLLHSMVRDVAAMGQDMAEIKERLGRLTPNQDVMSRGVVRKRQPSPRPDLRSAMAAAPLPAPAAVPDTRKPLNLQPTSLVPPSSPASAAARAPDRQARISDSGSLAHPGQTR